MLGLLTVCNVVCFPSYPYVCVFVYFSLDGLEIGHGGTRMKYKTRLKLDAVVRPVYLQREQKKVSRELTLSLPGSLERPVSKFN